MRLGRCPPASTAELGHTPEGALTRLSIFVKFFNFIAGRLEKEGKIRKNCGEVGEAKTGLQGQAGKRQKTE